MKASWEFAGVVVVISAVFALSLLLPEGRPRLMAVALAIVIGGGIMAFIRSRKATRR